jgi:hypothetical protein
MPRGRLNFTWKDKVIHLCVRVAGGQAIFMKDSFEPFEQGSGVLLNLSYPKEGDHTLRERVSFVLRSFEV